MNIFFKKKPFIGRASFRSNNILRCPQFWIWVDEVVYDQGGRDGRDAGWHLWTVKRDGGLPRVRRQEVSGSQGNSQCLSLYMKSLTRSVWEQPCVITAHWRWSRFCMTWVCFLPPKADRFHFYFILCKPENERSHLGCGRCIVYLGVQGEPHINVFLMCLSHVQSRREGKRPGGLLSPSPFLCLSGACLLEFWAN